MSLFAIFGSGFGLYGYLPALVSCGQHIVLEERYRDRFQARPELIPYAQSIKWESNEANVLECATGAVFALNPELQVERLSSCLLHPQIQYLLLEKPLGRSPQESADLLNTLLDSGKKFRIGYLFRYTQWGKQLTDALQASHKLNKLSIHWHFIAHHFRKPIQTWKRSHDLGGGVIRFYGIHIIALLAEIGYRQVVYSQVEGSIANEPSRWRAQFKGNGLPQCEVIIDTQSSSSQFQVAVTQDLDVKLLTDLRDPFDVGSQSDELGLLDQRVPILNQHCGSLWNADASPYEWYAATHQLWHAVEEEVRLF